MKRIAWAALSVLALASPALAAPGDMNVAEFLRRADALRALGPAALLSSDMGALRREGEAAGTQYRARLAQERTQGHPSSCPPPASRVSSDQLLAHLRTYPAAIRPRTTMRTAVADYMIRTYPCRS